MQLIQHPEALLSGGRGQGQHGAGLVGFNRSKHGSS